MVDVLRQGTEILGQDYVNARQHGRQRAAQAAIAASAAATQETVASATAVTGV